MDFQRVITPLEDFWHIFLNCRCATKKKKKRAYLFSSEWQLTKQTSQKEINEDNLRSEVSKSRLVHSWCNVLAMDEVRNNSNVSTHWILLACFLLSKIHTWNLPYSSTLSSLSKIYSEVKMSLNHQNIWQYNNQNIWQYIVFWPNFH